MMSRLRLPRLTTSLSIIIITVLHLCLTISASQNPSSESASSESSTFSRTITTKSVEQNKDTLTIKNKLATAEGRVSDLISRLDTVSTDATRAKSEIHNTLMEVWKVVDLLGRDQCGAVVEKVRIAQKKSETRVTELQEENRQYGKDIEALKLIIARSEDTEVSIQNELKAERTRRETLEIEVRDLRDKLHWASIMSNETKMYEVVSERLQNLLVVVSERTNILNRVQTMFLDAHQGFDEWQKEIQSLTGLVRDSERDFIGGYQGAAVDGFKRQVNDLETRLRNAESAREDVRKQRDDARGNLEKMTKRITSPLSSSLGNTVRETVIRRTSSGGIDGENSSWFGWITFGLISLGTGVVAATMLSVWTNKPQDPISTQQKQPQTEHEQQTNFGFTPTTSPGRLSRTPPASAGIPPGTSPLTFVDHGSGSRTPGSRNNTPRRY